MKTSSAKAKGRKLQDWEKSKILDYFHKCYGSDEYDDLVTTATMGEMGADVRLVGEAGRKFPFSIECKNQEKFSGIYNIIDQARNHSRFPPLAFIKMNRKPPLVMLEAEEFFKHYFRYKESINETTKEV